MSSDQDEYDAVMERAMAALGGARTSHAIGAMFAAFVGVCQHAKIDAGRQFEVMLSQYEKRIAATHRGSATLN